MILSGPQKVSVEQMLDLWRTGSPLILLNDARGGGKSWTLLEFLRVVNAPATVVAPVNSLRYWESTVAEWRRAGGPDVALFTPSSYRNNRPPATDVVCFDEMATLAASKNLADSTDVARIVVLYGDEDYRAQFATKHRWLTVRLYEHFRTRYDNPLVKLATVRRVTNEMLGECVALAAVKNIVCVERTPVDVKLYSCRLVELDDESALTHPSDDFVIAAATVPHYLNTIDDILANVIGRALIVADRRIRLNCARLSGSPIARAAALSDVLSGNTPSICVTSADVCGVRLETVTDLIVFADDPCADAVKRLNKSAIRLQPLTVHVINFDQI